MKMLRYLASALLLISANLAMGQTAVELPDSTYNIVEAINNSDCGIYVIQPLEMDRIVQHLEGAQRTNSSNKQNNRVGYRIQIYSDNNIRTARANAESRKRQIEQFMPEMHGYLTFQSPYWRVRFGDFTSYSEAEAYLREIKAAFPQYADDMRIVKERINPM